MSEREAWFEGYSAGHETARAVNPEYPGPTPNPYQPGGEAEPRTYVSVSLPSLPVSKAASLVETIITLTPGESVNVYYAEAADDD